MRTVFLGLAALCALSSAALAQTAAAPVLYVSPADAAAAQAKGKAATAMAPQPLVSVPGYRALLEYRATPTPASVHETEDELISVVDGSCTMIVGGTLKDQTRRNETNLSGSGIDGGKTYQMEKGAYMFVPAGTAHYFSKIGPNGFTIMTLHVPHRADAK